MQAIKTSVRQYIQDNFLMGSAETYDDDASFMDAQLLDSTGFLELVHFLEDSYGIKVEDEEMMPENLDSLDAVARFVMRKRAA
ncbi:acyl carrier protein [Pseudoxanthomonas wuyuanensis]